jgi:hypothetical protein
VTDARTPVFTRHSISNTPQYGVVLKPGYKLDATGQWSACPLPGPHRARGLRDDLDQAAPAGRHGPATRVQWWPETMGSVLIWRGLDDFEDGTLCHGTVSISRSMLPEASWSAKCSAKASHDCHRATFKYVTDDGSLKTELRSPSGGEGLSRHRRIWTCVGLA